MIKWCDFSKIPDLEQHEIHVWRIHLNPLETGISEFKNYLSAEELVRAASFHFIRDQTRFIIRRAILRKLLASYLKIDVETVRLLSAPNGKPFIGTHNERPGISFNCSHSANWALIAVAREIDLGVDIEHHRFLPDIHHMANACLSQTEIFEFLKLPEAMKIQYFFDAWTCKEAFVKAIGKGLSFPLKDIIVSNQPATLVKVENIPQATNHWKLSPISIGSDYSAAIVHENGEADFKYLEWNARNSK